VSFEALADQLEQADVGVVAQLPSAYSHLVHTTKMYEYFALGVPVVVSDLRATCRSFPDPAVYAVPGGDVAALRDALVELATDPEVYGRYANGAAAASAVAGWEATQRDAYLAELGVVATGSPP
jgi:glycosyltransferase involved in cell wall biosynthesis